MNTVVLLVPGDIETRTGGYVYDRRIVAGLRALGWAVDVQALDASFPRPTASALTHAAALLAAIPDGTTVVVDGLAYGAMPDQATRDAARLRFVALVHHPLAAETGHAPDIADRLEASETRALASARLVIVTSRATASALDKYEVSSSRIAVVEPGTDRAPLAAGSGADITELLCVATLTPRKGHRTLFRALAALAPLPWRLSCVGSLERDRATVTRLRAELRAAGLEDRVSFSGELDEVRLAARYDRADVFVLATEYEGYGMAVAEALARGLPIVSTRTGAIPEIVADAGLLVPPGDPDALADALSRVLSDAPLRRRLAHAAERARDRLPTWEGSSAKMAAVLERMAHR